MLIPQPLYGMLIPHITETELFLPPFQSAPDPHGPEPKRQRAQRADARRNRERVIETAFEVFAAEGLSTPVHEIARRAGVGTGTVSRHFPTKEALFEAVFRSRVERIVALAEELATEADHGKAFFSFFAEMVAEGNANLGLAQALAGAGFDLNAITSGDNDVTSLMNELLRAAQQHGAIRGDATIADVKALLNACVQPDAAARDRMLAIVRAGLAPQPPAGT
jgi:AcrR family transcriptional regulator